MTTQEYNKELSEFVKLLQERFLKENALPIGTVVSFGKARKVGVIKNATFKDSIFSYNVMYEIEYNGQTKTVIDEAINEVVQL